MGKYVFGKVENMGGGEGENTSYQHFLLFPQSFLNGFPSGQLKLKISWQMVKIQFCLSYVFFFKWKRVWNFGRQGKNG